MWCPRWPHRHTYSWGPKVKNVIFKQHLNCKTTSANVGFDKHAKLSTGICVRSSALRPSINGMKSKVNQVIWPSGKKRQRQGPCHRNDTAISSSFFCQHANISDTLGPIMLILGQSNKSVNAHFWHDQFGVKGHDGVTGVKKVIFTKIAISSTDHMVWSCDSCILIS